MVTFVVFLLRHSQCRFKNEGRPDLFPTFTTYETRLGEKKLTHKNCYEIVKSLFTPELWRVQWMASTALKAKNLEIFGSQSKKSAKSHELFQQKFCHITASNSSYAPVDTDEKLFFLLELWRVIYRYQNS